MRSYKNLERQCFNTLISNSTDTVWSVNSKLWATRGLQVWSYSLCKLSATFLFDAFDVIISLLILEGSRTTHSYFSLLSHFLSSTLSNDSAYGQNKIWEIYLMKRKICFTITLRLVGTVGAFHILKEMNINMKVLWIFSN